MTLLNYMYIRNFSQLSGRLLAPSYIIFFFIVVAIPTVSNNQDLLSVHCMTKVARTANMCC